MTLIFNRLLGVVKVCQGMYLDNS